MSRKWVRQIKRDDPTDIMSDQELVSLQRTLYESRNPTRKWLHRTRRDWISHAMRRFVPKGERALEVGPGSGVYIPVLKELCTTVYLADCEQAYLDAIRETYRDDPTVITVVDDVTRSRLNDHSFDLVLCSEVIEHMTDSAVAIRNLARVMKSNGILVLSTPQRYSSLELTARVALSPQFMWLTRLLYREPILELGHINLMTERELRAQISAAGLRIIEQHKGGLYLPGIAEFLGSTGQRIAAWLEARIRGTWCDGILWTQYYVLSRADGGHTTSGRDPIS